MESSGGCDQLAQAIGPQVRSRVTVVCAECKRLKLKCDRRAPCGSCTKRDTVARCIYSPAAAEKVDLHSLNNRLIAVESQLAQISAPGAHFPSSSSSTTLPLASISTANSYNQPEHFSSTMNHITAIWKEEIDTPQPLPVQSTNNETQDRYIKSEPSPHTVSHLSPSSNFATTIPLPLLLPPISHYYAPHPSPTSPPLFTKPLLSHLPFAPRRRMRLYEHAEEALRMMPGPCFSWRVWKERAEGIWRWVESEGASFVANECSEEPSRPSTSSSTTGTATTSSRTSTETNKADTARTIFFGPPPAPPPPSSQKTPSCAQTSGKAHAPSLPFFASVAGVLALALLVEESAASASAAIHSSSPSHSGGPGEPPGPERNIHVNITINERACVGPGPKKSRKDPSTKDNHTSPALLNALSRQAIGMWEGGLAPRSCTRSTSTSNATAPASEHDLDYISAVVLSVLFALLCDKGCATGAGERSADECAARGGAPCSAKEGWILGEIGKLVNIARTMGLDVDPDLTPGRYGLYESEARRRAWWDVWWWDAYTSILSSRIPLIPLHASSTRLPLDVDEEVFTFACTSAPLLSPTGKEGVGRWFGMRVKLAQLVKDINCRTALLSSLDNPSRLLSMENAAQCEAEIKQWLSDLPPAFRMEGEGMGEDPSTHAHPPMAMSSSSTANHGSAPPTLLAQRLDILMTAHRLAMGLYLPFLRPHSVFTSDSQSNAKLDSSPQAHQARVGALTAAHALVRVGRRYVELGCARPDLVRRRDGLGLSLCCGLVFDSGFWHDVWMGYSRALFDACVICASSALSDPSAVWARTAVEDAKAGLALLRDLRELSPAPDVSVIEALVRKIELGASSGSGTGSKRKRDGWDDGEGRDAIAVPGCGSGEESVCCQELKLLLPNVYPTPNTSATASSSTPDTSKDKSSSEPKRIYPSLVIPSKCSTRKDHPREKDLSKDIQRERDRNCSRGDKEKERKKASYPPVGYRVRPVKETSPLARGRTESVAPEAQSLTQRTTTQRMLPTQQSSAIMTSSVPMSSQPMPMSAPQLSVMTQPSSAIPPLRPPSLVSTPIDQPYLSTPTPMSQDGGVDFSLPFGAAYEAQSHSTQKYPPYDYASSSASPFSYPDTPQYAQFNNCSVPPSTPTSTSFAPPQTPHYTGSAASQSQASFPPQTQPSQYPPSQTPYSEQQQSRFSFGPQYPETGIGEYYGTEEKQPSQQQKYQEEYSGEQQGVYSAKPMDQHLAQQQGYAGEQQGYVGQGWTQGRDGAYWRSYESPAQPQPRYQE